MQTVAYLRGLDALLVGEKKASLGKTRESTRKPSRPALNFRGQELPITGLQPKAIWAVGGISLPRKKQPIVA